MKILKYLDEHLEEILLCVLLVIITFNTCLQTFMRYVLKHPLSWTDELSKFCFIYSGFVSIGYCVRKHLMVRIDVIKALIPTKVFAVVNVLVTLLVLVFFAFIFYASISTFQSFYEGHMINPALNIPMYYLYIGAVLGPALGIFRSAQSLITHDLPLCFEKKHDINIGEAR